MIYRLIRCFRVLFTGDHYILIIISTYGSLGIRMKYNIHIFVTKKVSFDGVTCVIIFRSLLYHFVPKKEMNDLCFDHKNNPLDFDLLNYPK